MMLLPRRDEEANQKQQCAAAEIDYVAVRREQNTHLRLKPYDPCVLGFQGTQRIEWFESRPLGL